MLSGSNEMSKESLAISIVLASSWVLRLTKAAGDSRRNESSLDTSRVCQLLIAPDYNKHLGPHLSCFKEDMLPQFPCFWDMSCTCRAHCEQSTEKVPRYALGCEKSSLSGGHKKVYSPSRWWVNIQTSVICAYALPPRFEALLKWRLCFLLFFAAPST